MKNMRNKKTYHSSLILLHQAYLLPASVKKTIPKSTLYSWKNRDLSLIVGIEQAKLVEENTVLLNMLAKYEKMLAAAKVLLLIFKLYERVLLSFKGGKARLLQEKDYIKAIADYANDRMSKSMSCRLLKTSPSFLKNIILKTPCHNSVFNLCKRIYPMQLTSNEVSNIRKYLTNIEFLYWPLSSVYYRMIRDKTTYCSLSAFYKYAKKLGIKRLKHRRRKDRNYKSLSASAPLEILHVDFTILRLHDQSKAYLHFVSDNFSRKIIAWSISIKPIAKHTADNLKKVLQTYILPNPPTWVISDDGSENKGVTADLFAENPDLLKHLVAQKDIIFSNSMAESVNKSMKYYHLFNCEYNSFDELEAKLPKHIDDYNSRPMHVLQGYTPNEAFEQKTYGKQVFVAQIAQAKEKRTTRNKENTCGVC